MNIRDLKKTLENYPDECDVVVDVPSIEPDDCGQMAISRIGICMNSDGTNAVIEIKSPYM